MTDNIFGGVAPQPQPAAQPQETFSDQVIATNETNANSQTDIFAGLTTAVIDTNEFENKPAGEYPVSVESLTIRTTKTGKIMGSMAYKIIGGEKFVGGFEFRPFFFNTEDKTKLVKDLGRLANAVAAATGLDEEKSKAATLGLLQNFEKGGREDVKVTDWFSASQGTLKLSYTETTKPDGTKGTWTNYKFTKQG